MKILMKKILLKLNRDIKLYFLFFQLVFQLILLIYNYIQKEYTYLKKIHLIFQLDVNSNNKKFLY